MLDELAQSIRDERAILFVGAGVSAGLGLPTWSKLISHVATELGYKPELFETFGSFQTLAEFYKNEMNGKIGKLRSWMDVNWHNAPIAIENSDVHNLILDLGFRIIYTTNYDRWLEKAHEKRGKKFLSVVNVSDIARITSSAIQIVKFHGDLEDDDSIILTESDYFERMDFTNPLDIKFQSDAIGKSILFIGYSANDTNIRFILYKLHREWERAGYKDARPKSFIFFSRPNTVQEKVL